VEGTCSGHGGYDRCAKIAVVKDVKKISLEGPRFR
jgi:hypothetical protein